MKKKFSYAPYYTSFSLRTRCKKCSCIPTFYYVSYNQFITKDIDFSRIIWNFYKISERHSKTATDADLHNYNSFKSFNPRSFRLFPNAKFTADTKIFIQCKCGNVCVTYVNKNDELRFHKIKNLYPFQYTEIKRK